VVGEEADGSVGVQERCGDLGKKRREGEVLKRRSETVNVERAVGGIEPLV
jgi:hypothetical protein